MRHVELRHGTLQLSGGGEGGEGGEGEAAARVAAYWAPPYAL